MIIFFGFFSCWYSTRSPLLLNELKHCWIFSIDVNYKVKNFIILQKFQLWSLTKYKEQFNVPCHCILSVFVHFVSASFFSSLPWQIFRRWGKELAHKDVFCPIHYDNLQLTMYIYKDLLINRWIVKFFSKHSLDLFDNVNSICISCFFYLNSKRKKHFLFFCWYKKNACILLPTWKQFEPF